MSSRTFMTISKSECQIVYKEILENSDKRWDAGKKLAEIGDYGGAISMAIISVEELVKTLIVFLDGKGFDFRQVKGMDTIFKNHKIRYIIAYAMLVMGILGEELMKFILKIKDDPDKFILLSDAIKKDKQFFEKKFGYYLFKKMVVIRREFRWFAKADIFRQDGFYCDYQEQLKNPIQIGKKDYKQVFQRLDRVRFIGTSIIDACNTQDDFYPKYIEEMKQTFVEKRFYEYMAAALGKVKQQKGNPFELVSDFIEPI